VRNKLIAGGVVLGLFAFGATAIALQEDNAAEPALENAVAEPAPVAAPPRPRAAGGVETIDTPTEADVDSGATPMAQRSAVIGLLNKRNGISRDLTLKPGQAVRIGDAVVRLSACERTAPWETDKLTGAFVQLDVRGPDAKWRRAFSGWLYKEQPSFNVVNHPIYDVWPKSCTMTFPDRGPDTIVLGAGAPASGRSRSSAPNADGTSPPTTTAPPSSVPDADDSAASSNAI
jgi:hypothetical protein